MATRIIKNEDDATTILKEYYARYLQDVRNLSKSSVNHYLDALNNISRRLKEMGLVEYSIYEIGDIERLDFVRTILYKDPDFIEANERGRRMYSAGLNNYYRFASGENFNKAHDKILLLDVPMQPSQTLVIEREAWKRSGILRTQAIELAEFSCELDSKHKSFTAESTKKPYMEGHHALPIKLQHQFKNSLDVYANIVCLCPICHRQIHYGIKSDREKMINQIYSFRADRLANAGIKLSKQEFSDLIV